MLKFSTLISVLFAVMITDAFSQELEKWMCYESWKWGYVDKSSGETVIPCQYANAKNFSEGLAAVQDAFDNKWGFIDKTGQEICPLIFKKIESFSEGLAAVKFKGKWGFIDKKGNCVISCDYKEVDNFSGGYAKVRYGKLWGVIDKNGTVIAPCIYDNIFSANAAIARLELERERVAKERERMDTQEQKSRAQEVNLITTSAYDIILLRDGTEIKAIVTEITPVEIKYKAFENPNGPTITLWKKDVFVINYANGTRDVIGTASTSRNDRQGITNCYKETAFGLDIGIGGAEVKEIFSTALGFRVMHHFSPYFGIDFFKVNWITDYEVEGFGAGAWAMRIQIMPGVRGNSPAFFKCMSVYTAFRLGYGMLVGCAPIISAQIGGSTNFEGLSLETELGLNATRTFFVGFTYNYHKYFGSFPGRHHTFAVRLGFNFGK